jgi:hypothetical protein
MSVAVVKDGKVVFEQGFGRWSLEDGVPVGPPAHACDYQDLHLVHAGTNQ